MLAWMADGAENVLLHNMSPHLVEALLRGSKQLLISRRVHEARERLGVLKCFIWFLRRDTDEISLADLRMFCHIAMACSAFLSGSCADSPTTPDSRCAESCRAVHEWNSVCPPKASVGVLSSVSHAPWPSIPLLWLRSDSG